MGRRDRCMHKMPMIMIVIALSGLTPVLHLPFHSPQAQLTWRMDSAISTFADIYDNLGEYFTDPCKRNCFAKIWLDSTLNLKVIHWDLRNNAYQQPCDLMVKPFKWQPKQQRKMQHWEKCVKINWTFHNFCSKESSIWQQHIFFLTISLF